MFAFAVFTILITGNGYKINIGAGFFLFSSWLLYVVFVSLAKNPENTNVIVFLGVSIMSIIVLTIPKNRIVAYYKGFIIYLHSWRFFCSDMVVVVSLNDFRSKRYIEKR
jgi:hypothetical protein